MGVCPRDPPLRLHDETLRKAIDFDPSGSELRASGSVRSLIVGRVRRCIDAGLLHGDEIDIAHVLVALTQGLAMAESSRRLGTTRESIERRWSLALDGIFSGLNAASSP